MELAAGLDPELFQHNALFVDSSGTPTASAAYFDEGATPLTDVETDVNGLTGAAGNRSGDCALIDPSVDGDFHLPPTSPCIDQGTALELPDEDFDGDPRLLGQAFDIGVDEVR